MADHSAEIAGEIAGLLAALSTLAANALRDNDPARLRRVREVIAGELAVEQVLREGEATATADILVNRSI